MLYEYECTSCHHISEDFRFVVEMNDPAFCEMCGSEAKKIMSLPQRSFQAKVVVEQYPMANFHLGRKVRDPKTGKIKRIPVVFENPGQRDAFYKANHLVDAITPEGEMPTMYHDGATGKQDELPPPEMRKEVDEMVAKAKYETAPEEWEPKKPAYDIKTGARLC